MSVLVVASHPDDEVLGCGGTVARLADAGELVHVLLLGEGVTSRSPTRSDASSSDVDGLRKETERAAEILGIRSVTNLGLPDNRFDSVDLLDVVKELEVVIDSVQPRLVFTQHGGDLNIDHQVTFRAVLTATRTLPGQGVSDVLAFEVGSSTEWSFQRFAPVFRPTVFYDVADTLERKLAAMDAYASEARPFPHPRSTEALRSSAVRWGSVSGTHAAEAFELIRSVR